MDNKKIQKGIKLIDSHFKDKGLSRRDAIKFFGVSGAATLFAATSTTQLSASSNAQGKILIIGGGLAGISCAARLSNNLNKPDITIVEPNDLSTSYQPGQTLVGAGVWSKSDVMYNNKDYIPDDTKHIKAKAMEFDPDSNSVKLSNGTMVKYDFLIISAGLKLDFGKIRGLEADKTITTVGDYKSAGPHLGKNGLTSIYYQQGSADTWTEMQKFISDAKSGKKVKGIFTHPNTPIKCGGAPKKIMYLTDARLREADARDNAELTFYPNGGKMFGVPEYHDAIKKQFEVRDMKWNYKHNLVAVDVDKKIATFEKKWTTKVMNEMLGMEVNKINKKEVDVPYDFLHISPPMKAAEEIGNSPVGSGSGWVPVNKETLQHFKYKNIFSLGDIAAVPMGKTGGSIRKQYKVLVDNVISLMEGKEMTAKYDGYTVCPLITGLGTVMLAEFNWTKKPTPSFPFDPTQERWIWWLLKVYLLKPMTQYGLLAGRA